jgi:hypothetical protein
MEDDDERSVSEDMVFYAWIMELRLHICTGMSA